MKKSFVMQNIMNSIVQKVLDDPDEFECFSAYFVDYDKQNLNIE